MNASMEGIQHEQGISQRTPGDDRKDTDGDNDKKMCSSSEEAHRPEVEMSIMHKSVGNLMTRFFECIDSHMDVAAVRKNFAEIAKYEDSPNLSNASRAALVKKRQNLEKSEAVYRENRVALEISMLDTLHSCDRTGGRKAKDTCSQTNIDQGVQTEMSNEEPRSQADSTDGPSTSERTSASHSETQDGVQKESDIISAVVDRTMSQIHLALPMLVEEKCRERETNAIANIIAKHSRESDEMMNSINNLRGQLNAYISHARAQEQRFRQIEGAVAYLSEEARQLKEAFDRRQGVDKDILDILQNHTANISRHEELLYVWIETMKRVPTPSPVFGIEPIPGISHELGRAAAALANPPKGSTSNR